MGETRPDKEKRLTNIISTPITSHRERSHKSDGYLLILLEAFPPLDL